MLKEFNKIDKLHTFLIGNDIVVELSPMKYYPMKSDIFITVSSQKLELYGLENMYFCSDDHWYKKIVFFVSDLVIVSDNEFCIYPHNKHIANILRKIFLTQSDYDDLKRIIKKCIIF